MVSKNNNNNSPWEKKPPQRPGSIEAQPFQQEDPISLLLFHKYRQILTATSKPELAES